MRSYNNELQIYRNETFSITKKFENKDGSPYIVSNELQNPYLLLTISSSRYEQDDRYTKNYWHPFVTPRFSNTVAVNLKSIMTTSGGTIPAYNDFPTIPVEATSETVLITGYIGTTLVESKFGYDVFYLEDVNGNKIYKYADIETKTWKEYNFKYVFSFSGNDTKNLLEQNYLYSITLVSGTSMLDFVKELYTQQIGALPDTYDKYTLYNALIDAGKTIPDDLVIDREIYLFDTNIPLLVPTKLTVLNNLQGGLIYGN